MGTASKSFGFLILVWALAACAPEKNPQSLRILDLDFACSSSQVPGCSSALGRTAFLGLKKTTIINCNLWLSSWGLATLYQNFDYSSQTDVRSDGPGEVWGRFQSFFDSQNSPAPTMEAGFYVACGFIDANSNGFMDSGEPMMSELWNPSTDLRRVFEDWSPAP